MSMKTFLSVKYTIIIIEFRWLLGRVKKTLHEEIGVNFHIMI